VFGIHKYAGCLCFPLRHLHIGICHFVRLAVEFDQKFTNYLKRLYFMTTTLPKLENLLDEMRSSDKLITTKDQLICASGLVYYGGLAMGEIPKLTVGDVIDKKGEIVQQIDKLGKTFKINGKQVKKPVMINEKMKAVLWDYLRTTKQIDLKHIKRRAPLFPAYQDTQRLRDHWKEFRTNYSELLNSGIRSHIASCRGKDMLEEEAKRATADQFRHTRRSIEANVTGKMIPAGKKKNDPRRRLLELSEYAGQIEDGDPDGKRKAEAIMSELEKVYKGAKGDLKKQIEGLRDSYFLPRLSRFLGQKATGPAASIPNPSTDSSPDTPSST
jgi:hypothetical protein